MTPLRVVKLGGSLLGDPRLACWIRGWLACQSPARHVLVAGGGSLADVVRRADVRYGFGPQRAHELSIRTMRVTAHRVSRILPEARRTDDVWPLGEPATGPSVTVVDCTRFLASDEPLRPGTRLIADWSVTSDSIAARLAVVLEASELILLKSALPAPPDAQLHLASLAECDYVDSFLPRLAHELPPLRLVDLRGTRFPSLRLQVDRAGAARRPAFPG